MSIKSIPVRQITAAPKQQEVAGSPDFSIRDVGQLLDGRDLQQDLHRHDFFLIMALEKGNGSHDIDFNHHELCDRCVFFMRPGQVHRLNLQEGSAGFLMQFKSDFYPYDRLSGELLRSLSRQTLCQLKAEPFRRLMATLKIVHQEYRERMERFTDVIRANLNIFFIELLRNKSRTDSDEGHNPYHMDRLEEFLALVESNLVHHKDVAFYADQLHLSSFQLNAITKRLLGKTSSEIIDEHVILEGKRYLLATTDQVNQIAYKLGFEDPSYFIRFFKKHTRYSPEAFRRNFK